MRRTAGKGSKALEWCEPSGALTTRSPRKFATSYSVSPRRKRLPPLFEATGGLKIVCIGCWMSLSAEMNRAFDKAMQTKISRCDAILASICCVRNDRLALASMPSVSRLVGITPISSAFWMGLIRCDCPADLSTSFDENHYFVVPCKKVIGDRQQESTSSGNLYPSFGCPSP